jgi:hypothetical protein
MEQTQIESPAATGATTVESASRRTWLVWIGWIAFVFTQAIVNAESGISEAARRGRLLPRWEPWTWELTSAISLLALTPAVVLLCRLLPIERPRMLRNGLLHLLLTVPFSILHVVAMVGLRELVYASVGGRYDFGDWTRELFYEYRKDFVTYLLMVAGVQLLMRWQKAQAEVALSGARASAPEASNPAPAATTPPERYISRLLVQSNFREQFVAVERITWIEADGNYVKLHTEQGTLRPRMTLAALESQLDPSLFARIHRSHIVNLARVKEIQPWFHGDFRMVLQSGETLPLSRRFRDRIKSH